jgi:hypothetical protein
MSTLLKAGVDYVWLVLAETSWGKGDTEKLALKQAKENGGSQSIRNYRVYLVPPLSWVNDFGDIHWDKVKGKTDNAILVKIVKNGKEVPVE